MADDGGNPLHAPDPFQRAQALTEKAASAVDMAMRRVLIAAARDALDDARIMLTEADEILTTLLVRGDEAAILMQEAVAARERSIFELAERLAALDPH